MPTSSRRVLASAQRRSAPGGAQDGAGSEHAACEHLLPLLELLVHGHGLHLVERVEGLGSGLGFLFDGELPIAELAAAPREPFVHVIASRRLVFCERCWQSLGEWALHRDQWS